MDPVERINAEFLVRRLGVIPDHFVVASSCVAIQPLTRSFGGVALDCHGFAPQ